MSRLCPQSCCQLLTAAAFIAVGVVQAIAGVILLNSKYVSLLSVPNFWTSAANISVGCLLGIMASSWKKPRKHSSLKRSKHATRDNLVTALLGSSLMLNASTLAILILGKGKTMISIGLQDMPKTDQSSILGKEILAYAFVTSVVCPVICMILALFKLAEKCWPKGEPGVSDVLKNRGTLEGLHSHRFDWVFINDSRPNLSPEHNHSPSSGSEDDISMVRTSLVFSSPQLPTSQIPKEYGVRMSSKLLGQNRKSISDSLNGSPGFASQNSVVLEGDVVAIQVPHHSRNPRDVVAINSLSNDLKNGVRTQTKMKGEKSNVSSNRNSLCSFKTTLNEQLKEHFIRNCPKVELERGFSVSPDLEYVTEFSAADPGLMSSPAVTSGYISNLETTLNTSVQDDGDLEPKPFSSCAMNVEEKIPSPGTGAIAKVK